jgi:murein DD-endopeptidase MepM/ murein hydrolase activator NlpD
MRGPQRASALVMLAALAILPACGGAPPAASARAIADIHLPREFTTIENRMPVRTTLDSVLRGHSLGADVVTRVIAAAQSAFDLRALRAGQPYRISFTLDGVFRSFEYMIDRKRFLRVSETPAKESAALTAEVLNYPIRTTTSIVGGAIDKEHSSLVAAVDNAGEELELALLLADVFGGQVDFNSDLQPGDQFEVLVEKDFHDRDFSGYGDIVAATLVNSGRRLQAFRFVTPDGKADYFDEEGRSVRRFFLPSPLPFDPRVTSRFSRRRAHPVDGIPRAHLGVDYAAAVGTPVLAVANGVVVSAGFSGASGRLIRLRHPNGYETYYLHLSSIGKGVRPGARVMQGDVIGRVGASGVVTGPHLDYRVAKNSVFVDPLLERRKLPSADALPAASLPAFAAVRDEALARLAKQAAAAAP